MHEGFEDKPSKTIIGFIGHRDYTKTSLVEAIHKYLAEHEKSGCSSAIEEKGVSLSLRPHRADAGYVKKGTN